MGGTGEDSLGETETARPAAREGNGIRRENGSETARGKMGFRVRASGREGKWSGELTSMESPGSIPPVNPDGFILIEPKWLIDSHWIHHHGIYHLEVLVVCKVQCWNNNKIERELYRIDFCRRSVVRDKRDDSFKVGIELETLQDFSYKHGDWLVFGSETSGLPPEALFDCNNETLGGGTIRIPMVETYVRCLNLSVSVGIAVYEASRQLNYEQLQCPPKTGFSAGRVNRALVLDDCCSRQICLVDVQTKLGVISSQFLGKTRWKVLGAFSTVLTMIL
ncbi:hypothetical protein ACLOJK_018342 [Asimina triloba]